MASAPKYHVKGNLSEKQIEADVSSFMGWCTPPEENIPFRLLDIDEQVTGADKLFDRAALIFIQFKKSSGLKSTSSVKPSIRKNRSPLESIREFRSKYQLEDDLTLFFQLRQRASPDRELQHNVLLGYERPPFSRAIYVAPLLLDKTDYHRALHNSSTRFLLDPFYYRTRHLVHTEHWVSRFGMVPFLREHVSIPPHEEVTDHNHYFAYSETGTDISWHSPSIVQREPSRLSDFLSKKIRSVFNDSDGMTSLEGLAAQVREISIHNGFLEGNQNNRESPIDYLRRHAKWLSQTYEIRQFLLMGNSDQLAKIRDKR